MVKHIKIWIIGTISGFLISLASSVIAKFSTSWLISFGPSGVVGGWPVSFVEYDFSEFFRTCLDCIFQIPPGSFLVVGRGLEYGIGEFSPAFFLVNTLFWIFLALGLVYVIKYFFKPKT